MTSASLPEVLRRIQTALHEATLAISPFAAGKIKVDFKSGNNDPITEADRASNRALRAALISNGEGWLSEETEDDSSRVAKERVWIVDPLDGTREFVAGIPEWCISVALVERGQAIAGGICNPATRETFLGCSQLGVLYNGQSVCCSQTAGLPGATILASRSEVNRGEWDAFQNRGFTLKPVGSVAYKLALVAAGLADATWTLCPKHEWDVAAGIALINAAGGAAHRLDGTPLAFNRAPCLLPNLLAGGPRIADQLISFLKGQKYASVKTKI